MTSDHRNASHRGRCHQPFISPSVHSTGIDELRRIPTNSDLTGPIRRAAACHGTTSSRFHVIGADPSMPAEQQFRRIERCSGTGRVTRDGLPIGEASYVLEVYRKDAPGEDRADGGRDPEETRVRIRLRAPTFARTPLAIARAVISVHLEDGRVATGVLKGNALVLREPIRQERGRR